MDSKLRVANKGYFRRRPKECAGDNQKPSISKNFSLEEARLIFVEKSNIQDLFDTTPPKDNTRTEIGELGDIGLDIGTLRGIRA